MVSSTSRDSIGGVDNRNTELATNSGVTLKPLPLPVENLFPLDANKWSVMTFGHGKKSTTMQQIDGENVISVFYPKGSRNPAHRPQGGLQFFSKPKEIFPADHVILSYSVRFADNFDWVLGGKLPGLVIGGPGATGGRRQANKGSYRVMWGTNGAASAYMYPPEGAAQADEYQKQEGWGTAYPYGDGLWNGVFKMEKGTWNTITLEMKLNSMVNGQPQPDGLISLKVNNTERSYDKMVWRAFNNVRIHSILFESFFGGGDDSWSTPVDTYAYFKDVQVTSVLPIDTSVAAMTSVPPTVTSAAPSSGLKPCPLPVDNLFPLDANKWGITKFGYGKQSTKVQKVDGDSAISVFYPKGSRNPSHKPQGGVLFYGQPKEVFPADHVILEYSVKFADNFDWVLGGKLPGLIIGAPGASGGKRQANKGSYRVMWGTNGVASAYMYPPEGAAQADEYQKQEGWGTAYPFGDGLWNGVFKMEKGTWNTITMELKLNSMVNGLPQQDGLICLKVNNTERSYDKMVWRAFDNVHIHSFLFESFFGGGDDSWSTPVDTYAYFKDVQVTSVLPSGPSPS